MVGNPSARQSERAFLQSPVTSSIIDCQHGFAEQYISWGSYVLSQETPFRLSHFCVSGGPLPRMESSQYSTYPKQIYVGENSHRSGGSAPSETLWKSKHEKKKGHQFKTQTTSLLPLPIKGCYDSRKIELLLNQYYNHFFQLSSSIDSLLYFMPTIQVGPLVYDHMRGYGSKKVVIVQNTPSSRNQGSSAVPNRVESTHVQRSHETWKYIQVSTYGKITKQSRNSRKIAKNTPEYRPKIVLAPPIPKESTPSPCPAERRVHKSISSRSGKLTDFISRRTNEGYTVGLSNAIAENRETARGLEGHRPQFPNKAHPYSSYGPLESNVNVTDSRASGIVTAANNGSDTSPKTTKQSASKTRQHSRKNGRKRPKEHQESSSPEDTDFDTDSDQDDDGRPKAPSLDTEHHEKVILLQLQCPYYAHDSEAYRKKGKEKRYKSCPCGQLGLDRLKEHIKRKHENPIYCHRCFEAFKTEEMLITHTRLQTICSPRNRRRYYTPELAEEITRKTKGVKDVREKWKVMYKIIFPEDKHIPEPVWQPNSNDGQVMQLLEEVMDIYKRQLPRRIQALDLKDDETKERVRIGMTDLMSGIAQTFHEDLRRRSQGLPPTHKTNEDGPFPSFGANQHPPIHPECIDPSLIFYTPPAFSSFNPTNTGTGLFGASHGQSELGSTQAGTWESTTACDPITPLSRQDSIGREKYFKNFKPPLYGEVQPRESLGEPLREHCWPAMYTSEITAGHSAFAVDGSGPSKERELHAELDRGQQNLLFQDLDSSHVPSHWNQPSGP